MVPTSCITSDYYIIVDNQFVKPDYRFITFIDNKFVEIKDTYTKKSESFFTLDFYMTSDTCKNYTFIQTFKSQPTEDFHYFINDLSAPSFCHSMYYICFNITDLNTDFQIGYNFSYVPDNPIVKYTKPVNIFEHENLFSMNVYLVFSPGCQEMMELAYLQSVLNLSY